MPSHRSESPRWAGPSPCSAPMTTRPGERSWALRLSSVPWRSAPGAPGAANRTCRVRNSAVRDSATGTLARPGARGSFDTVRVTARVERPARKSPPTPQGVEGLRVVPSGASRARTGDPCLAKAVLSQLSYGPICASHNRFGCGVKCTRAWRLLVGPLARPKGTAIDSAPG